MLGRRVVAAGVVVAAVTTGAVAGAIIGIPGISGASNSPNVVTAASDSTTTTTPGSPDGRHHMRGFHRAGGDVFAAAAKALNLSTEDLLKKLSDGKTTIADVAQAQNVPLSDVTDAMKAVADKQIDDMVNKPFPTRPDFKGGRHFRGGPGFGGGFIGGLRGSFDNLAKALGVTPDALKSDLADGKSIADIAKANNVDIDTVINSLVTDATAKIDQAVKDGHLTQDQADKIESGLKDMITKAVNGDFEFGGFGRGESGHGGFPGFGGPGFGGPGGFPGPGGPSGASGATGSTEAPAQAG